MKIKTAVFGGSFDPIHTGHAMMANHLTRLGIIDELWLMPSRLNPLKANTPPTSPNHRLAMCDLVARKCDNTKICDVELSMPEPSYTIDTLNTLRKRYQEREFLLLIGSDNWQVFDKWHRSEEILEKYKVIIYPRPGYAVNIDSLHRNAELLEEAPQAMISSTYIREGIRKGFNMNFFIPDEVLEYIKTQNLYG